MTDNVRAGGDVKDTLFDEAMEVYSECLNAERDNRRAYDDDIRFGRLGEQWDEGLKLQRLKDGRPCLTINKLPPFIRQVVNDGRQNRPQIRVMPQDSYADPETAKIMSGLIRNIETSSDADTAYDTALDCSASGGFGYYRINLAYVDEESWDQDIVFERIVDPRMVHGDPWSQKADSSDWNVTFKDELMTKREFRRRFPNAQEVNFNSKDFPIGWHSDERILVSEFWKREEIRTRLFLMTDGSVMDEATVQANRDRLIAEKIVPAGPEREVMSYKVKQYLVNGQEILNGDGLDWAGKYIPFVPVYGEEVWFEGKRHLRSLIRDAKDPQMMYNAWRTSATEMVAMAPRVPFIGPKGAFTTDIDKWETINSQSWAFVEYDDKAGGPPQRQPLPTVPAANIQEALNASDDIKATTGIYDAGLGQRSNETSGRAILARQRESDVSTFHYIDNLSRSIRHAGRILIDLIPKVYSEERVIRILGEQRDLEQAENIQLGTPEQAEQSRMEWEMADEEQRQAIKRIYSFGIGKYDLTVSVGPSFTTRREEAAFQMTELIRAYPAAAPVLGDLLAKNLDWPGADEIAERLKALQGGPDNSEEMQMLVQQIQMLSEQLKQSEEENANEARKLDIDAFDAETKRLKVVADATKPIRSNNAA